MEEMKRMIEELQKTLTMVLAALSYQAEIEKNKELIAPYKSLSFIYRVMQEYAILKIAELTTPDFQSQLNINTPLNYFFREGLDKTLSEEIVAAIKLQKQKILSLSTTIFGQVKDARNKYIANNDFFSRSFLTTDMEILKEDTTKLIKHLRDTCNTLNIPTFSAAVLKENSIQKLLTALSKNQSS